MKPMFLLSLLLPAALLAASCNGGFLDSPLGGDADVLVARTGSVTLEPASFSDGEMIEDTVVFTSGLSWSASLPETAGWVRMDKASDINLSGEAREYAIRLEAGDNDGESPRNAVLTITTSSGRLEIPLVQGEVVPSLSVSPSTAVNLPCDGGTVTVEVRSNVSWRAKLASSTDAAVTLSAGSGFKSGSFSAAVLPNLDDVRGRTATIIVSAVGCEDCVIEINQDKYRV